VPSFDVQAGSRGQEYQFSSENWSHSTSYFVGQLKKIDQAGWNRVIGAAKVYFAQYTQELRKGPLNVKIEEAAETKNLEFKWDSD
jgi:hypothetical protein